MKQNGLYFTSDQASNKNKYAILGGKTSIGYRENARDGINGIIFYCAKDKEDCNRFISMMNKEVYPNGNDNTRPFKI